MPDSKIGRLEKILLLLWFVVNLVIGVFTVPAYGMSGDERNNYRYANDTLNAYPSLFGTRYEPKYDSTYDGHGPAFVAITALVIRGIQSVFPNTFTIDLWHFSYFITFQLACLCMYWLTKRWFSLWTAWGILLLFSTQPLLLGHSFINPKDIPFMALFTLSVALGLRLVNGVAANETFVSLEGPVQTLTDKFQRTDPRPRRKFLTYLALALVTAFVLIVFSNQINSLVAQVVTFFYTAESDSWAGRLFNSIASHASNISVEDYALKAVRLFNRVKRGLLFAGALFFLAYFGLLSNNTSLPAFLRSTWKRWPQLGESVSGLGKSLRNFLRPGSLKIWFAELAGELRNPRLILAGIALGLATGVRAIAPLAGVIVFVYLFTKVRSKAWTTAIACFLVAGVVTYLVWPRLWDSPILRYLEGLGMITGFPHHTNRILFNGRLYGDSDLPRSYVPLLLNLQFTEPFILGSYIGLGVLGWQLLRRRVRTDLLLYIAVGFVAPLLALILLDSPLYHNFRQALFMIPAMFMFAAFALELIFSKMTRSWARALLIVAIALPGIYSSVKLYPYEYVYYNSLIGGTAGARNRFELDYWRTSLREVALELNEIAPHESKVLVTHGAALFVRYSRPDLVVDKIINSILGADEGFDYVVQVSRWDRWDLYPEAELVIIVERNGIVFATAKALKNVPAK